MKKLFAFSLLLSSSALAFGQSLPPSNAERNLQITVWVSNRVHMPPRNLAQVEQVATQILRRAGVQAVWLDCTMVAAGHPQPACDHPFGPTDLSLKFVEEIQSLSPKMKGITLGLTLGADGGGRGDKAYAAYIYISNRRAHDVATECEASAEMVLGLAAVHEIGHLLTGSGEHSRSGLMRAQWDAKDLERAARGDLQFTDNQVKKLHAGVLARME